MKNFQRDNRSGGSGGWKGPSKFGAKKPWERSSGGGRDTGDRPMMHKATCNECGQSCEVPFKPNGRKPVFCSNCFKREEGPAPQRFGDRGGDRGGDRDSGRQMFGEKPLYKAVCDTCGNSCEVPFRPTGEKPIYCRQCFVKPVGKGNYASAPRATEDYKEHFRMINKKLDTILKALSLSPSVEMKAVPKEQEFTEETDVFSFEMPKEKKASKKKVEDAPVAKKAKSKKRTA